MVMTKVMTTVMTMVMRMEMTMVTTMTTIVMRMVLTMVTAMVLTMVHDVCGIGLCSIENHYFLVRLKTLFMPWHRARIRNDAVIAP